MQRYAIDEPAHQRLAPDPQQLRSDMQAARLDQGAALAAKQMARWDIRPPRHAIDPAQHGIDLALFAAKPAALDSREHVPLQQDAFGPARRQDSGVVFGHPHAWLMRR